MKRIHNMKQIILQVFHNTTSTLDPASWGCWDFKGFKILSKQWFSCYESFLELLCLQLFLVLNVHQPVITRDPCIISLWQFKRSLLKSHGLIHQCVANSWLCHSSWGVAVITHTCGSCTTKSAAASASLMNFLFNWQC